MALDENRVVGHYMMNDPTVEHGAVVALCNMSRAAAIIVHVSESRIPSRMLETLRSNLRQLGTRWILARKYDRPTNVPHA